MNNNCHKDSNDVKAYYFEIGRKVSKKYSFMDDLEKWAKRLSRRTATAKLIEAGVGLTTAIRLLDGKRRHAPREGTRALIEKAMK